MRFSSQKSEVSRRNRRSRLGLYSFSTVLICGFIFLSFPNFRSVKTSAQVATGDIENAIFTRQEFFGAQAIVPLPTAEARENLAKLAESSPANPQILVKLAELDEKLSRFDEAENNLKVLAENDASKLDNLAAFYERRAQFEEEAETIKKILFSTAPQKRAAAFERLIDLARKHDLKEYLQTAFYAEIAEENPDVYQIFERLIDTLTEEKNYAEALNFARQARTQFPGRQSVLLEKEVEILLAMNNPQEAEKVYQAAFNPLWSEDQAQKFYDFLNNQDRLRAYGAEVKMRFKKNPADFDAAIRLALYQNHDYSYENDDITPTILKLEQAKKNWTVDELVTVSRLLLQAGETDLASRFLYTLYLREDFKTDSELRAKILYQLFELFSDAENQKLPLTKGDLRFYEDVAKADTNPGIATGILSLIFSDANPREKLAEQETKANKFFNRAAAYRIFEEYKREFPTSNELAQMHLDIVRLYTATKETEIAEKTLNEFAERYENSSDYPAVALKLADAFVAAGKEEKAREIYQKLLDYLGKQDKKSLASVKIQKINFSGESDETDFENAPYRNDGINIPNSNDKPENDNYYDEKPTVFRDYLGRKNQGISYEEVLEKFVASFAKEKKTTEILALYSNEIVKHENEEWLYERRLAWLEQTNLTAEQAEVYKAALARFQTNDWRDKLARFFVRNKRNDEFAAFSEDVIGKLNDADTQHYLSEFAAGKTATTDFEGRLYFKLYQAAHARFPHNISFVSGLLRFYKTAKQEAEWRKLSGEYYFEAKEIRESFLDDLARTNRLRDYLEQSNGRENTIYELFRADASARLSNYENAVAAYRKLNEIYPNTLDFSSRLINFTRSFGQKNRQLLTEAAKVSNAQADFLPVSAEFRTRSGEIFAELGNYEKSREEWEKLLATAKGDKEIYLDTATVYWDYFQYEDALRTIKNLRDKFADDTLYAFETGAILEAQNGQNAAVGEYVKAFDAGRDEVQKEKATKRLATLYARKINAANAEKIPKNEIGKIIEAAFAAEKQKRKDNSFLSLGYAEFLLKIKQTEKAASVLNQAIRQSENKEFLETAQEFYQTENNGAGEQFALQRLGETAVNPRQMIAYRLQLADSFAENRKRDSAKTILSALVRQFPTNYGVLIETSDFYKRLGFENESAAVLESALPNSRGAYSSALARKLAGRLIQLDRLDSAEQILTDLHGEDESNVEIFDELARVYVRTNQPEALRKTFAETVSALKKSDADRRELDGQIAGLRVEMIDAFTRLKDYKSAIEQHIEIINREPENEQLTENAINYVRRYGDAETLIEYYEKTSAEAFKNYRWNVVLARIYEADKNYESALKNYRAAIGNQPEMPELYLAIADIENKSGNYDEALKNIDEVLDLTGDEAQYVRKKIEILKKAGRLSEIEAEKTKLPIEEKKVQVDQFAEARNLQITEKEKAREIYRQAFGKLVENPLRDELKASDIAGYAQSLRDEEPLDEISERLWFLRGKLLEIADEDNSTDAGEARKRLSILDGALIESIGATAKNVGTDEELKNLHDALRRKVEETPVSPDRHQTLSLIQDLSRRAGFGDLEELNLQKKVEAGNSILEKPIYLRNLVNFYNERGAYQKAFDALEKYGSDDLRLKAETAKIIGNREKELEALRAIYWKSNDNLIISPDENVARYLDILHSEKSDELKSLTEKSSVYQLQLINFLLGKGERELAHAAIESSNLSAAWKVSRHAETSLALREYDNASECFFCAALQFDVIGEMINQTPDKKRFLINDDWFCLTREYGEWLYEKKEKETPPSKFLAAMIENQPRNADRQFELGTFYLEKNELKSAIEHLRLAVETENSSVDDKAKLAALGAAYFKSGANDYAEECWAKVLEDETIESGAIYFETLQKYNLSEKGREKLPPIIVRFLQTNNADNSEDFQHLIRAVAASFDEDEARKSAYFKTVLRARPTDKSLAAMLVNENLIGADEQMEFYELLINRNDDLTNHDYNFTSAAQRIWATEAVESIYEQGNEYKTEEPENEKYDWRKKYLELLVRRRENARAGQIITDIEKQIKGRYARPAWLRLAKIRLQIRANTFVRTEAEQFTGIIVNEAATEIKPPSVERFNDVLQILKEENRGAETVQLSEDYFARMLALEQFDQANFTGLAKTFFQKGETEKAIQILHLMVDASDGEKKETALAAITAIDVVKKQAADAAKFSPTENNSINFSDALELAAELAAEFEQTDAAIAFRRQLLETNPFDAINKIELSKMFINRGEKQAAADLLTQIVSDKNSPRLARWQARLILNAEIPNSNFDAFSQFYNGTLAEKANQREAATEFFIRSLIADRDAEIPARQNLIKLYALSNMPFAALKLAEIDKSAKSDELLKILSETAEKVGDFQKAIEFENARLEKDAGRISVLDERAAAKNAVTTDFKVDLENTRKL